MDALNLQARSVFQECDFCKLRGVLGRNIFNKDGWYFCKPCLMEVEFELEKRKKERDLAQKPV